MTFVPLERRFVVWADKTGSDPDDMSHLFASDAALRWPELLAKHRVVVLAEAGSGKSTELSEQARLSIAADRTTFAATVQSVGRRGLPAAIGRTATAQLEAWRVSDQPAWFFFDSVDEAKASDVRLEDALKAIAEEIHGAAARAHIILSGRHTDWEFRRDLKQLERWIAVPPADTAAQAVDPNELIVNVFRRDNANEPPPPAEAPLVVVMAALDRKQVEAFARGKCVTDVEEFFRALDKANLWAFARRPLDLGWLVEFWRTYGAFGPLADMLELSLRQRLLDPDVQRARTDPIDADRAMAALERMGAALVLQGLSDIAVPDSALDLDDTRPALDLADILPDWSGSHRARLISRGVFDPASIGMARIHNDNEGDVRSFLAARWLNRLTVENCPTTVVLDLLFSTIYDTRLVIPSMRQTAAWLSLCSLDVANEIIKCDPRLLMDAGDPSSLPLALREQALRAVIARVVDDDEFDIPDRDALKRFAMPDIAPSLRNIWESNSSSPAVREVLLLMIWLGELTECADLAVKASYGTHADRYTQVFSGRALMAVASEGDKQGYASYLRDQAGVIPSALVWDGLDALFPNFLSVNDLLGLLESIDVGDRSEGLGLDYHGPKLAERLRTVAEAEALITGLLDRLESRLDPEDARALPEDEPFLTTLEAAGRRLLEMSPTTNAPDLAIDVALRLGESRRRRSHIRSPNGDVDLFALLQATPERRRLALWRAAERFAQAHPSKPITDTWQIEIFGFCPILTVGDFDWLLHDAEHRQRPNERQIAANAALRLWRQGGEPADQMARINATRARHAEVAQAIEAWTRPRSPSEEDCAHKRAMRRIERRHTIESAEHDRSWRDFADRLRADPDQLRRISPPTEKGVDARLYNLWRLLSAVGENRSRYAIADLSPLETMLGGAVVAAFGEALMTYWRQWSPALRSERPADKRNSISALDCIGIVGVSLEAVNRPDWAKALTHTDAVRAAIYGTLELNGFPAWFASLAQARPDAVRAVLLRLIAPELASSNELDDRDAIETIARADVEISSLIAERLFEVLAQDGADMPLRRLASILDILAAGYPDRDKLLSLMRERFDVAEGGVQPESLFLATMYKLDPSYAMASLVGKLPNLSERQQTLLVQNVLPRLFGDGWGEDGLPTDHLPFASLENLVRIAFKAIRFDEDNDHSNGEVYSPDSRDYAESARGAVFKALVETPGRATYEAIHRLMADPEFPIRRKRMLELASKRAGADAEFEAWTSANVCAFEKDFLTAPRNPFDLQRLALRKITDLQHDLLNADYAQGATVARLPNEVDVQNWMADRLRNDQGRSYSIEREPHVVEEKEPDIRFRAKASDANVPMEIKVAESWSLDELRDASRVQLAGRYLRDRHNRCGILLLVHQEPRPKGWLTRTGQWLSFGQVVDALRELARSMAAVGPNAPQVEIAVIDVSSVYVKA